MLLLWVIGFSVPGSVGVVAGAAAMLLFPGAVRRSIVPALVSCATGTLLGAAFLGMLPAALDRAPARGVMVTVLAGIATIAFFRLGGLSMTGLNDREIAALREALDDEYNAFSTYDQVIADFGEVRPFLNIRGAEARHIDALLGLFGRYNVRPPANQWPGKVDRYPSIRDACAAAVEAEIANAALYERLLASTGRSDILMVFRNLRDASQERHLAAFRRCVERRP